MELLSGLTILTPLILLILKSKLLDYYESKLRKLNQMIRAGNYPF
jgi:hypothetical protein